MAQLARQGEQDTSQGQEGGEDTVQGLLLVMMMVMTMMTGLHQEGAVDTICRCQVGVNSVILVF